MTDLVRSPPVLPSQHRCLGSHECRKGTEIDDTSHGDEAPVVTVVGLHNSSGNRDTDEASERDNRVRGGVVSSIFLSLAKPSDTDGRDSDTGAAGKAEEDREEDNARGGVAGG